MSVGNDDGCSVSRLTVGRPVASSAYHKWIFLLNLCQSESRRKGDMDRPTCKQKSFRCHYQLKTGHAAKKNNLVTLS